MAQLNDIQREEAKDLFRQGKSTIEVMRHFGAQASGNVPSHQLETQTLAKTLTPPSQGFGARLMDIPQDIGTGIRQLGEGYIDRFGRLQESGSALVRGEQGALETGGQFAANIAGGAIADPAYQLLRTGGSLFTTEQEEQNISNWIGEKVTQVDEQTGLSNWFNEQTPRTQRNIMAGLDLLDVAPVPVVDRLRGLFKPREVRPPTQELREVFTDAYQGDSVSGAAKVVNSTIDDAARQRLVDELTKAYNESIVGNLKTYNRRLQDQAADMSRGGEVVTQDDLVRALAEEGIIPDMRDKLADFSAEIRRLEDRQKQLFEQYRPILEQSRATAGIEDFKQYARESMSRSRSLAGNLDRADAELDRVIANLSRYFNAEDGRLTASQIDEMSRIANAETKAFNNANQKFEADVYSELGRASRKWLEENIPDQSFRAVNDEWIRLNNLKTTAENLRNAQVDVGIIGRAIGSYVTTVGATALAAPSGNPVLALLAGMLTKMGGDAVADWMRTRKFSDQTRDVLQKRVLERDAELLQRLKDSATTQANKNFFDDLSRRLPPPREGAPRSRVTSGVPIQVGGETPRGRVEPGITERVREGAVRQPEGDRQPTVLEERIRTDQMSIDQALLEMDVEISERPSVTGRGGNIAQDTEGNYYRFSSLPTWIPKDLRDGDLLDRVMQNIRDGKQPRSNATNEQELQKVVQERIANRVEELRNNPAESDRGVFSNDAAFAAALMVGGTYYLASEDGEMLPVISVAALATPQGRNAIAKTAKKAQSLPEAEKARIAEALESYETSPMVTRQSSPAFLGGTKDQINLEGSDANFRLQQLKEHNETGKITNAEWVEARVLLEDRGVLGKASSGTTKTTDLAEQAETTRDME